MKNNTLGFFLVLGVATAERSLLVHLGYFYFMFYVFIYSLLDTTCLLSNLHLFVPESTASPGRTFIFFYHHHSLISDPIFRVSSCLFLVLMFVCILTELT